MEPEFISPGQIHVACDTNVVRYVIDGGAPWLANFEAMASGGIVFSLMDHTVVELLNQLDRGIFTETQYAVGIKACAGFISPKVPILPGKKQMALWCASTPDMQEIENDVRYREEAWRLIQTGAFKSKQAEKVLEEDRKKWREHIDKPRPNWAVKKLKERLDRLAGELDDDVLCSPPLMLRLDAALRHEDKIICLRNRAKNRLDMRSKKRKNDGIDYNMSYVFMKRILLCTEDKYRDTIRNLASFQSDWIFRPQELVDAWKAGTLVDPAWPISMP